MGITTSAELMFRGFAAEHSKTCSAWLSLPRARCLSNKERGLLEKSANADFRLVMRSTAPISSGRMASSVRGPVKPETPRRESVL